MKKTLYISILIIFLLASCSNNTNDTVKKPTQTKYTKDSVILINFANKLPDSHINIQANYEFKRLVEEKSNGKMLVQIFSDSELGSEQEATKLLQNGEIQMESAAILTLANYDSKYNLLMLPFLFKDTEHLYRVLDSDIADEFLYPTGMANFIGLSWLDAGNRNFYNSQREIKTVEDFKGLHAGIEDSDIIKDLCEALGMTTEYVSFSRTYDYFKNNNINASENNFISFVTANHNEVATYVTEGAHVRIPELIIVNKEFFNSLPYDYQVILKESAIEATNLQREALKKEESKRKQEAIDSGVIITELSPKEFSNLQETAMPIYDKYTSEKSKLIDKILEID